MHQKTSVFFDQIMRVHDPAEIWDIFIREMAGLGFPGVIYAYRRTVGSGTLSVAGELHYAIRQEPPDLADQIDRMQNLPNWIIRWSAENTGALSYGDMRRAAETGDLRKDEADTRQMFLSLGMRAGYAVSLRDATMSVHGLLFLNGGLGVRQHEIDAIWQEHGDVIQALCQMVHLRLSNMAPFGPVKTVLSSRQCEVLQWVAAGKTSAEIAIILGLKPVTVEKHLRLAREALDAQTTAQAVMIAAVRELIFMPPEG